MIQFDQYFSDGLVQPPTSHDQARNQPIHQSLVDGEFSVPQKVG